MPRVILTGAPGAGKTAIIRELSRLGLPTVDEAATELIHELQDSGIPDPWRLEDFADRVAAAQMLVLDAPAPAGVEFHDRSALCSLALARYLGLAPGPVLEAAVAQATTAFDRRALLIKPIGFITPTRARQLSYEQALEFERVHIEVYQEFGFALTEIAPGEVGDRARLVLTLLG